MDQPELSSEHAGTKSVASQTDDDTGTRDQQGRQFLRSLFPQTMVTFIFSIQANQAGLDLSKEVLWVSVGQLAANL